MDSGDLLVVGRISGLFGVRGWIRIFSHTEPRENILNYPVWYLRTQHGWEPRELAEGYRHGKGVVAQLKGIDDRDMAKTLLRQDIAIRREQLPQSNKGEYYWVELIGLQVLSTDGVELGKVDQLMETGANDVLVVEGERQRLIPFDPDGIIRSIDLETRVIVVDWDPDF